jgi:apolipoprotein N-acyltransferase
MASSKEKLSWSSLARRKPYGLVLLSGILLAASFPPSPVNYLIYIAFVPLMVLFEKGVVEERKLEDGIFLPFKRAAILLWRLLTLQFIWRPGMRGLGMLSYQPHEISGNAQLFRYSYAAFFIWNVICCYWIMLTALGAANLAEALVSAVAGVVAITINPILMSVPLQLHARLRRHLNPELGALCLAVLWLAFEYLHMNWELGWPWLTLGNALSFHPALIQYAEYTGVLGISAQILLCNWLVYVGLRWVRRKWAIAAAAFGGAMLLVLLGFLLNAPLTDPARPALQSTGSLRVRMVQPNIDPYPQAQALTVEEQIEHYSRLILATPLDTGRIVMLPEKAIAQALEPRAMLKGRMLAPLWALIDSFQVEILTGLEDYEDYEDTIEAPISAHENYRIVDGKRHLVYTDYYNSAWVMHVNRNTQVYRKGKLVPMVERVPFLRGLRILKFLHIDPAKGMASYGRPDSLRLLYTADSIPTSVLICYESAFGDHTRQKTALGAQWIAMITNDGWWGNSSGYVQHAGLSIIRAIENRRTIARCANNGRSMIVAATGETSQATAWWTEAVIDADIPLYDYQTFYVRHGDYIGQIACVLSLALMSLSFVLRRLRRNRLRP